MGGDLVGNHALAHLLGVGQPEVFFPGHVAQHVRPVPPDHRRADRRRDVIVARGDVGHERPERVERRLVADRLLLADVLLDQVHRDMAGALDHHLDVLCPRARGELPQRLELGELGAVVRVGD